MLSLPKRYLLQHAMNRLDHARAMQNVATNLSAAKGRVEDADFAAETSNLARVQVLQRKYGDVSARM